MCPGKPGTQGCTSVAQGKVRLWVNLDTDQFNCWHCGFNGGNLSRLMVRGSAEHREYLAERDSSVRCIPEEKPPCNSLPQGFKPFHLSGISDELPYIHYLKSRNISERTIALYRMNRCISGDFSR